VGDGEPFYKETLDYIAKLQAAGVDAKADVYPSNVHAFDMLWPDTEISKAAISRFNEYLEMILKQIEVL
jgi:acetyl esterase/lipase